MMDIRIPCLLLLTLYSVNAIHHGCDGDFDCRPHAYCTYDWTCECKYGGYLPCDECEENKNCPKNLICNGTACVCKFGVTTPEKTCPIECEQDWDCSSLYRCNGTNKCECKFGEFDNKECVPECNYNSDCPKYASCSDKLCNCDYGGAVHATDGKVSSCNECQDSIVCTRYAICSWGKCKCKYGQFGFNGTCPIECSQDSDCITHAKCNTKNNTCRCKHGGTPETSCSVECDYFNNNCPTYAVCNSGECHCQFGGSVYAPGGKLLSCNECSKDRDCSKHARCSESNKCECKYGGANSSACSNECSLDAACPRYAECNGNEECSCKFGGAIYAPSGRLTSCNDQCNQDDDCPKYARCTGKKCSCKYGGSVFNPNKELLSCNAECNVANDCPMYGVCSADEKCSCKYGGSVVKRGGSLRCIIECRFDNDCPSNADCIASVCECRYGGSADLDKDGKLVSCPENVVGIVCGVVGAVLVVSVVVGVYYIVRRRRLRRAAQTVYSHPFVQSVPDNSYPPTHPTQQYQPPSSDSGFINHGYAGKQPPPSQ